jgi:hypothetical protein
VTAAACFAATFLAQKRETVIISQRFFGIPPLRFYALADGIKKILSRGNPSPPIELPQESQLELRLGWETQKNVESPEKTTEKTTEKNT